MIEDGLINIDTEAAQVFGFTSNLFNQNSYLWKDGNTIIISLICVKRKGAFRELIRAIVREGFDFEIPTPSARMREIGMKQKWNSYQRYSEDFGEDVEILTNKEEHDEK